MSLDQISNDTQPREYQLSMHFRGDLKSHGTSGEKNLKNVKKMH